MEEEKGTVDPKKYIEPLIDEDDRPVREILGENIAFYRKKMNMSRSALAEKIGVTEAAIGQYERGIRAPSLEQLIKLSNTLNVPVDHILGHDSGEYDAVQTYRFNKAKAFVESTGLTVEKFDDGHIAILKLIERAPRFSAKKNTVFINEGSTDIVCHLDFKDSHDFIRFVEFYLETNSVEDEEIITHFLEDVIFSLVKGLPPTFSYNLYKNFENGDIEIEDSLRVALCTRPKKI